MNPNDLPQVRTLEQLQAVMADIGKCPVAEADLIWFACIGQAEVLSDSCTLKDIAGIFQEGLPKMDLAGVAEYVNSYFEDEDESQHETGNRYLIAAIARFYGDYDLSNAITEIEDVVEHE